MLGVQLPPGPLTRCPGGPARSGRHALTVESMGSNPIQGTDEDVSAGHRRAQVAVTHPQLLCRFNSCPTHCTNGLVAQLAEQDSLKVEVQGSTPSGATGRWACRLTGRRSAGSREMSVQVPPRSTVRVGPGRESG